MRIKKRKKMSRKFRRAEVTRVLIFRSKCQRSGMGWRLHNTWALGRHVFARESSYCFQRVLGIAIPSVCPSVRPFVCHTNGSVKNCAS